MFGLEGTTIQSRFDLVTIGCVALMGVEAVEVVVVVAAVVGVAVDNDDDDEEEVGAVKTSMLVLARYCTGVASCAKRNESESEKNTQKVRKHAYV